jgi:hypothetical protein
MIQGTNNIIGAIIRQIDVRIGDYSYRETRNTLFLMVYSCFFFIGTILQRCALKAKEMEEYEKDPDRVIKPDLSADLQADLQAEITPPDLSNIGIKKDRSNAVIKNPN